MVQKKKEKRGKLSPLRISLAFLLTSLVVYLWAPLFPYQPLPAQITSEQAKPMIFELQQQDSSQVNPVCKTRFFPAPAPMGKTSAALRPRVVLIFHGFTNCPQQFETLGKQLQADGYTVLIPRLPYHGYKDRLTPALQHLTEAELLDFANTNVDIASALSDDVTVIGLSAGGLLAAWAAETRTDIDTTMVIAPNFHHPEMPVFWSMPATKMGTLLPDRFEWWDNESKEKVPGPEYAYPRFPLSAMLQTIRIGHRVRYLAWTTKPTGRLIFVTNAEDTAVNKPMINEVLANWQRHGANLTHYQFPLGVVKTHDIIDPNQPNQNIRTVYPKLIELLKQ